MQQIAIARHVKILVIQCEKMIQIRKKTNAPNRLILKMVFPALIKNKAVLQMYKIMEIVIILKAIML